MLMRRWVRAIDLNIFLVILLWWVIGFLTSLGNEIEKSGDYSIDNSGESSKDEQQHNDRKSLLKHILLGVAGPILLIHRVFFKN